MLCSDGGLMSYPLQSLTVGTTGLRAIDNLPSACVLLYHSPPFALRFTFIQVTATQYLYTIPNYYIYCISPGLINMVMECPTDIEVI